MEVYEETNQRSESPMEFDHGLTADTVLLTCSAFVTAAGLGVTEIGISLMSKVPEVATDGIIMTTVGAIGIVAVAAGKKLVQHFRGNK